MWAVKVFAKLILARLPIPYKFWKSIGLFQHGQMDFAHYVERIFNLHVRRAFPSGLPPDRVILELGPGDSIGSALFASVHGAKHIWLVDVGDFARKDVAFYQKMAIQIAAGGDFSDLFRARHFNEVLRYCRAAYLTSGLESLKSIPTESVDFIWSHSVLEHIRKGEVMLVLKELKRILKPGGLASHNIDFQDHLAYSLNSLRFSEKLWESDIFAQAGFYTNRIPAVQLHAMFKEVGFSILMEEFGRWPELPIPRKALHADFQGFSDNELLNRTSSLLLQA